MMAAVERAPDLVALNLALDALEQIDARESRVVELRYFCGLSVEETAARTSRVSGDGVPRLAAGESVAAAGAASRDQDDGS